ncbi:hypothetical protein Tco_0014102 [Tanacetum coccineum]
MIGGVPYGLIDMVIKDLDLEPKIDAMMMEFLNLEVLPGGKIEQGNGYTAHGALWFIYGLVFGSSIEDGDLLKMKVQEKKRRSCDKQISDILSVAKSYGRKENAD